MSHYIFSLKSFFVAVFSIFSLQAYSATDKPPSETSIQQANVMVQHKWMTAKETKLNSVTSVGIGFCNPKWIDLSLGLPTTTEVRPNEKGVMVGFKTESALKNFARMAIILGDSVTVHVGESLKTENVTICGVLRGHTVPESIETLPESEDESEDS